MSQVKKDKKPLYRRSTPVGRLRRNAAKIARHASLVMTRLSSWGNVDDNRVVAARGYIAEILEFASRLDTIMSDLENSGFAPPKRPCNATYVIGQRVSIGAKFRHKYELAFESILSDDPGMLDDLVISNVLPTGEYVVQRGKKSPFMVAKSHLAKVKKR